MSRPFPPVYAAIASPRDPGKHPLPASRETGFPPGAIDTPRPRFPGRRAVVAEPHPRSRAAIEHVLVREGYRLVRGEEASEAPVLLFAGAGDGLHILEARDVDGALRDIFEAPGPLRGEGSVALGIHAFVPRPFGVADILRVARAVEGFDCRRRTPETQAPRSPHAL